METLYCEFILLHLLSIKYTVLGNQGGHYD